jgi:hypothetical protein
MTASKIIYMPKFNDPNVKFYVPILERFKGHRPLGDMFGACYLWGVVKSAIGCKCKVDEANWLAFLIRHLFLVPNWWYSRSNLVGE